MLLFVLLVFEEREINEVGMPSIWHLGNNLFIDGAVLELRKLLDHAIFLGFVTSVFAVQIHDVRMGSLLKQ